MASLHPMHVSTTTRSELSGLRGLTPPVHPNAAMRPHRGHGPLGSAVSGSDSGFLVTATSYANSVQLTCNIAWTNAVTNGQQGSRDRLVNLTQGRRCRWSEPYGHSLCWWSGAGSNRRPS